MTIWNKEGAIGDLNAEIRRCKGRLARLYKSLGLDFYITCKRDGNHTEGSCHPEGDAIDFKRQGVPKYKIELAAGTGFDVIEYADVRDIFHVEYDPK